MIYCNWTKDLSRSLIYMIHLKWFPKWHRLYDENHELNTKEKIKQFIMEEPIYYKDFFLEKTLSWIEKGKRYWINSEDYISTNIYSTHLFGIEKAYNSNFELADNIRCTSFDPIWEVLYGLFNSFDTLKKHYVLSEQFNKYYKDAIYINDILINVNDNFEFDFTIEYGCKPKEYSIITDWIWEIIFNSLHKKIDLALIDFLNYLKTITIKI